MELPTIESPMRDAEADITYVVVAYRPLTRGECVHAIRTYNSQNKRKLKRGSVVRIITTFGFDGQ